MLKKACCYSTVFITIVFSQSALSDGLTIDKVYHPYVQLLETEIEYQFLHEQNANDEFNGRQRHKLGIGRALSDAFFAELSLIGSDNHGETIAVDAFEVELKWQLTEQGEYDNDWGVLFELEKEKSENSWETSVTLIGLHEWSDWILTGNLSLIYEWGDDIDNEWETAFASQLRYKYKQQLEPAIELYLGQDTKAMGPVLTGSYRLGVAKKMNWEFGVIFGMGSEMADATWKLNMEYEF